MASVASQLIEKVIAHVQSDSLGDSREICADGTYMPNNLRTSLTLRCTVSKTLKKKLVKGFKVCLKARAGIRLNRLHVQNNTDIFDPIL